MKKLFITLVLTALLAGGSQAIKVEKLPFMSDFYVGMVNGIGMGIDLGVRAIYPLEDLRFGLEVEQLMTDVNYSMTLNATRFGACCGIKINDNLTVFYHMGGFNFMPSRLYVYTDSNGKTYTLNESTNYKGTYWAVSVDYLACGFIISPRFVNNTIFDQGVAREVDVNVGKSFSF